jgi:hypothetical protein
MDLEITNDYMATIGFHISRGWTVNANMNGQLVYHRMSKEGEKMFAVTAAPEALNHVRELTAMKMNYLRRTRTK